MVVWTDKVELLVKVLVTEHNLFADLEASAGNCRHAAGEESAKDTASPLRWRDRRSSEVEDAAKCCINGQTHCNCR